MSTTKPKAEVVTLNPIKVSSFSVHIEGTSDLILCKKPRSFELPEIFKQSHPKGTQIPSELNQPYNLWEKLITGIHWEKPITFHDEDWSLYTEEEWMDYMKNNRPCLLGKAFTDAMREAFISCGFKESTGKAGTDFKRTISVANIVPIEFGDAGYSQHLAQTFFPVLKLQLRQLVVGNALNVPDHHQRAADLPNGTIFPDHASSPPAMSRISSSIFRRIPS